MGPFDNEGGSLGFQTGTKTEPNGVRVVFARWGSLRREIPMDLTELAARWGIEPSYFDVQGRRRDADAGTIRRIVEALSAGGNQPAFVNEQAKPPESAFQGDGRKCWVLVVQLYGVRSR